MDIFQYSFMQRAFGAGILIGLICPILGVFLVLRRLSLIGDALAHISLAGVATGVLAGINPTLTSLTFATAGTFGIEFFRKKYEKYAELAIAIIMSTGLGLGVILISFSNSDTSSILGYLFGSIVAVSNTDLTIILFVSILVMLFISLFYRQLFYVTFDEDTAKLAGIPVQVLNIGLTVLTALTISVSIKIVGVLLVSSMMTLPVATALRLANSFKQVIIFSLIQGQISIIMGLIFSYKFNLAPGGSIILTSLSLLLLAITSKKIITIFQAPPVHEVVKKSQP